MNCPVCESSKMREVEKDGILIDVCPTCKGVWLDRGELEKLMKDVREVRQEYNSWYYGDSKPGAAVPPPPPGLPPQQQQPYAPPAQPSYPPQQGGYPPQQGGYPQQQGGYPPQQGGYPQQQPYYGKHSPHGYPYKKKKSVLDVFGDLFD